MNGFAMYASKNCLHRLGYMTHVQSILKYVPVVFTSSLQYATTFDTIDCVPNNIIQKHIDYLQKGFKPAQQSDLKYLIDSDAVSEDDIETLTTLTSDELDKIFIDTLTKNKHEKLAQLIKQCNGTGRLIHKTILIKIFNTYSANGNVNIVTLLQAYCLKIYPKLYERNGEYQHFIAKAQCMRGNSQKGLTILMECYVKNENLRGLYRFMLRELIYDSVQNRSEASLVIFKRHVLSLSETWDDHYPLLYFWHICWASTWFSDQMLANELLELSKELRNIVKERSPAFSMSILHAEYNEDAVTRLLQSLLKYGMLKEYARILQILFGYKLKNHDIRGCREIINNCEALGIPLSSNQQGKYIKMLINTDNEERTASEINPSKNFKLRF